jgi:hypothetical protein
MCKLLFFLVLPSISLFAQKTIGKTEGAEILENDNHYEIIFKTSEENYSSFYIDKDSSKIGIEVLKKYFFLLFSNKEKNSYLLQFKNDSVLLTNKDNKVRLEKWKNHNSDKSVTSQWFTFKDYLNLFKLNVNKNSF